MTPIASLYAAIPLSGALIFLFTVEQLINGWRHGFDNPEPLGEPFTNLDVQPRLNEEHP
jgi:TRAP-type C4-dicarboxylate transport system permease small subunit